MKLTGITACVFDAYGTLFDVHAPVRREAASIGPRADEMSRLWREKQLQYTWLRSLMGAHADFAHVTADALDYAMATCGIADEALKRRLLDLYRTVDAYPDAVPCLKGLRAAGFSTALLSNGSPDMLDAAVASAGMGAHLDAALSVEDAGIYKPDPRVYRLACDRFAAEPGQICFVTTNAWDASGAAFFGLRVVRLDRFGLGPERLPGEIAATIGSLEELPALIAG